MSSTPYDRIPYPARLHPQAHPDRLASMGRLFGLPTPPLEGSRVLELGCGEGGNLIPAAFSLPDTRFVGLDLSAIAAARAAEAARELVLDNVEVRPMDVCDFPADAGRFDYIVVHGVYSWVPAAVRDRILAICRDHLSEHGVAYVSYNAYPGCRLREVARDAMAYFGARGEAADPIEEARRSKQLLRTLAGAVSADDPYTAVVRGEADRVEKVDDAVLFHDDLSELNAPVYFHQFAAHAARHGLQYLSEADYADSADRPVRPGLAARLDDLAGDDVLRREQCADFLVGRAFRRTLLCHASARLDRPARPEALRGLRLASQVRPVAAASGGAAAVRQFKTPQGATLSTNHPAATAALAHLGAAWPLSLTFGDLLRAIGVDDTPAVVAELGGFLLTAVAAGAIELHVHAPRLTLAPGQRPLASALARWQAQRGPIVTTLTGATVMLDGAVARALLTLLDGRHDRASIVDRLTELAAEGQTDRGNAGRPAPADRTRELIRDGLEPKLAELARLGLLVE